MSITRPSHNCHHNINQIDIGRELSPGRFSGDDVYMSTKTDVILFDHTRRLLGPLLWYFVILVKSLELISKYGNRRWNLHMSELQNKLQWREDKVSVLSLINYVVYIKVAGQ